MTARYERYDISGYVLEDPGSCNCNSRIFDKNNGDGTPGSIRAEATEFAEANNLALFAWEPGPKPGPRNYLVASYRDFYELYRKSEKKTYNEFIGRNRPVKPFGDIDLKYNEVLGKMKASDEAMENVYAWLCDKVKNMVNVICTYVENVIGARVSDAIITDASNSEKFSQHFVINLVDGAMLLNKSVMNYIANTWIPSNEASLNVFRVDIREFEELAKVSTAPTTNDKDKSVTNEDTFVEPLDTGVYSPNGEFRVLFSTKYGANRPLLPKYVGVKTPGHENGCLTYHDVSNRFKTMTSEEIKKLFFRSLVVTTDDTLSPPSMCYGFSKAFVNGESGGGGGGGGGGNAKPVLLHPLSWKTILSHQETDRMQKETEKFERITANVDPYTLGASRYRDGCRSNRPGSSIGLSVVIGTDQYLLHKYKRMIEKIRDFTESHFQLKKNNTGLTTTSEMNEDSGIVIFKSRERFCPVINREHGNNTQFFCVSLRNKLIFQRCFHPGCAKLRRDVTKYREEKAERYAKKQPSPFVNKTYEEFTDISCHFPLELSSKVDFFLDGHYINSDKCNKNDENTIMDVEKQD